MKKIYEPAIATLLITEEELLEGDILASGENPGTDLPEDLFP